MPSWRNPAPASSASSSKPFSPVIPPPLAHRRATRGLASRPLPSAPAFSIQHLPLSCERGSLVPLRGVREPNPRTGERKMKSEQIKEITDKATEQLVDALNAGHSEALTGYLKAIGRFHRYSFLCCAQHKKLYVIRRTMLIPFPPPCSQAHEHCM